MNAACVNTDGSFRCQCDSSYTGNGTSCAGQMCNLRKRTLLSLMSRFLHNAVKKLILPRDQDQLVFPGFEANLNLSKDILFGSASFFFFFAL